MLETIIILVMGLLGVAAVSDIKFRKIPNWIPLGVFALFWVFIAVQFFLGGEPVVPPLYSVLTGLGALAVFTGLFYFNFLGGGDVKLISAVAFWAGPGQIVTFILIMALTGGVLALFYVLKNYLGPELVPATGDAMNKKLEKNRKDKVKPEKKGNNSGNIPYGIAISAGGLFAVYPIFTNLTA